MIGLIQSMPYWVQVSLICLPVVTTVFAGLGLFQSVSQQRRNNALSRAVLVADHLSEFSSDDEMQRAFYLIEYSKFEYNDDFHGSEHEPQIDRLLRHFSNVALFWKSGLLSLADLEPLKYQIIRVGGDPEIQKYIDYLRGFAEEHGNLSHPFEAMAELYTAVEKEIS